VAFSLRKCLRVYLTSPHALLSILFWETSKLTPFTFLPFSGFMVSSVIWVTTPDTPFPRHFPGGPFTGRATPTGEPAVARFLPFCGRPSPPPHGFRFSSPLLVQQLRRIRFSQWEGFFNERQPLIFSLTWRRAFFGFRKPFQSTLNARPLLCLRIFSVLLFCPLR